MNKTAKIFSALLFLALAAYGQQKEKVAIINTVDDGSPSISHSELSYLTKKLRGIAVNALPPKSYDIMTDDYIIDISGSQEDADKKCEEAGGCLAKLGREIKVHYIAQARIGRFGGDLTIAAELYDTRSSKLLGSLEGKAKDMDGLLSVLEAKASDMFKKMPGASGGSKTVSTTVAGGISGVERAADYQLDGERRFLVNINTEPTGAALSFNGIPSSNCPKTPCRLELGEGDVRIIAALQQHETADTTVSIARNNQSIAIALKSNFGILEIKPAYIDGIGEYDDWNLSINDKRYNSFENRFSPGNYSVKLSHKCYEVVNFMAGINKGSREVFDMAGNIKLKKGGLDLSAEKDGEPVVESVFVNGMQIGETPFSDAVPLCSEIEIGENKETVFVTLKHNEKVKHTHKSGLYAPATYTSVAGYEKPSETNFWALGLDVMGAIFILAGIIVNFDVDEAHAEYSIRGQSQSFYDDAWQKVEGKRNGRNVLYVIGGLALASGIGVHIWF